MVKAHYNIIMGIIIKDNMKMILSMEMEYK